MDFTRHGLPLLALLVSFLVGSIPFGLLMARIFKVQGLRQRGSGNVGATNVTRLAGLWPAGVLTFVLDAAKGALPVAVLAFKPIEELWQGWLINAGFAVDAVDPSVVFVWLMGFFAVLGHCFSPWLNFKGGKGVATSFGMIAVLSPVAALAGLIGYGASFFERRISSLSSLCGLVVASIVHLVLHPIGVEMWVGAVLIFVILARHESNIDALLENREPSFE